MRLSSRAIVIKDNKLLVMGRNRFGHQFVALPGGGVEEGESTKEAAVREIAEECSLKIDNLKLVIIEDAGEIYGIQYIYSADYVSGQLQLDPKSVEAKITKDGKNLYEPKWLDLEKLKETKFLPVELKDLIVEFIEKGFPESPVQLKIAKDSKV
jgi:ADP-ribose pyrophosphatase YjhB (NUDIX family)